MTTDQFNTEDNTTEQSSRFADMVRFKNHEQDYLPLAWFSKRGQRLVNMALLAALSFCDQLPTVVPLINDEERPDPAAAAFVTYVIKQTLQNQRIFAGHERLVVMIIRAAITSYTAWDRTDCTYNDCYGTNFIESDADYLENVVLPLIN